MPGLRPRCKQTVSPPSGSLIGWSRRGSADAAPAAPVVCLVRRQGPAPQPLPRPRGRTGGGAAPPGPYLILPNHPAFVDPPTRCPHCGRRSGSGRCCWNELPEPGPGPAGAVLGRSRCRTWSAPAPRPGSAPRPPSPRPSTRSKAGDNVILWPSGRLMRDGVERLGGTRSVADILAAVPDVTVVLVRTRGLWGSMFSFAQTAERPNLIGSLLQGLGILLTNLLLFTPRRRVTITLEAFAQDQRPEPTREAINRWLEAWYNADSAPEKPTYVPYHFLFGPRTYDFPPPPRGRGDRPSKVKPETKAGGRRAPRREAQAAADRRGEPAGHDVQAARAGQPRRDGGDAGGRAAVRLQRRRRADHRRAAVGAGRGAGRHAARRSRRRRGGSPPPTGADRAGGPRRDHPGGVPQAASSPARRTWPRPTTSPAS